MPDSYTHVAIAQQALLRSGQVTASEACYTAGANGPDPLYFFELGKRHKQPDLPAIGRRIHKEKTGDFLSCLLLFSITPQQQSFTQGFLAHYITDCTLNPYIAAMGDKGFFRSKRERLRFEASIDSELFYRRYRMRHVPAFLSAPRLTAEDLGQVASLLHDAILDTYGEDVPIVALSDAYHSYELLRERMAAPSGLRRFFTKLTAPLRYGGQALSVTGRLQPAPALPPLPEDWQNPYTAEAVHLTFDEVVAVAESTAGVVLAAAMRYWLGQVSDEKIREIVGDNNYYTGRPCADDEAAAPEAVEKKGREESNEQQHLA